MVHKRTIRAVPRTPAQTIAAALATLINRGSFHGGDLSLRISLADNVVRAERAIAMVAAAGLVMRGSYEPSCEQLFFGLGGFAGDKLTRLDDQHRSAAAYHWITATTRYLEPADVEAVLR